MEAGSLHEVSDVPAPEMVVPLRASRDRPLLPHGEAVSPGGFERSTSCTRASGIGADKVASND